MVTKKPFAKKVSRYSLKPNQKGYSVGLLKTPKNKEKRKRKKKSIANRLYTLQYGRFR